MSLFGQSSFRPSGNIFGSATTAMGIGGTTSTSSTPQQPDFEINSPPSDTVQALKFSPKTVPQDFLASGSWDNLVFVFGFLLVEIIDLRVILGPNMGSSL